MTAKRKTTVFILIYLFSGISGMLFCGDVFHTIRHTKTELSSESCVPATLRLIDTAERDEAFMMVYQDQDSTFYQYPIVKDIPCQTGTSTFPENITRLTISSRPPHTRHRKNICVLKMSIIVKNAEQLPMITDNLGSEFQLRTRESETGEILLYVRKIFKGDIPQNYILWIDGQEIILN